MTSTRPRTARRLPAVLAAAGCALVALAAPATAAAAGPGTGSTTGPAAAVRPADSHAERQVDRFLTQYRDAVEGDNPAMNPEEVLQEFLTPEAHRAVHEWEQQHGADGVFRAQNLPESWTTRYEGSGAGHTSVAVVFDWGSGHTTEVWYRVVIETQRISDVSGPR